MTKQRSSKLTRTRSTLVLSVDGTERSIPGQVSMEELRKIVGGWVGITTCIYQDKRLMMVVNDDGHPLGLPYNRKATELYLAACVHGTSQAIVGDVAVLINWQLD